jgi:hypothetical protein
MFYSQENQDCYLETNVFKGFKHGVFVDVGAYDGKHQHFILKKPMDWIEPNPRIFDSLINRPNCNEGETDFLLNTGYTEMLSGIKNTFDQRHVTRLENENTQMGSTEVVKLTSLLQEHNLSHVHYPLM